MRQGEGIESIIAQGTLGSKRESKWRLVGFIAAGLFGLGCVLGAVGLLLILHAPPPPVVDTDPAAAQRLQQKLEQAQLAAARGAPGVVSAAECMS